MGRRKIKIQKIIDERLRQVLNLINYVFPLGNVNKKKKGINKEGNGACFIDWS